MLGVPTLRWREVCINVRSGKGLSASPGGPPRNRRRPSCYRYDGDSLAAGPARFRQGVFRAVDHVSSSASRSCRLLGGERTRFGGPDRRQRQQHQPVRHRRLEQRRGDRLEQHRLRRQREPRALQRVWNLRRQQRRPDRADRDRKRNRGRRHPDLRGCRRGFGRRQQRVLPGRDPLQRPGHDRRADRLDLEPRHRPEHPRLARDQERRRGEWRRRHLQRDLQRERRSPTT